MKVNCYAKINLYLKVLGKEGKLHALDMLNTSLSLFDQVEIVKCDKLTVLCDDSDIKTTDNIAYKTAKAFMERFNTTPVKIDIKKGIPKMAGLGGSSSDGAAVVFAMSKLFNVNLTEEDYKFFAQNLSSDLPYMINGGYARVYGTGEKVEKIDTNLEFKGIIVKSQYNALTKDVYQKFDALAVKSAQPNACQRIVDCLKNGDKKVVELFENDLTLPAKMLLPDLEQIFNDLQKLNPNKILLCGSGGCVAAIFLGEVPSIEQLKQKYKEVYTFTTRKQGMEIVQ